MASFSSTVVIKLKGDCPESRMTTGGLILSSWLKTIIPARIFWSQNKKRFQKTDLPSVCRNCAHTYPQRLWTVFGPEMGPAHGCQGERCFCRRACRAYRCGL